MRSNSALRTAISAPEGVQVQRVVQDQDEVEVPRAQQSSVEVPTLVETYLLYVARVRYRLWALDEEVPAAA